MATLAPASPPAVVPAARSRWPLPASPTRQAASAVALVLIWQAASAWLDNPSLLPSPLTVLSRAAELAASGALPRHMATSLGRVLVGFAAGAVLGTACGLVIGRFAVVERLVDPTLNFVRSVPPIALVPFSIIVFGIGETSKYAIVAYLVFIVLALSAAAGVRETPRIRIRAAQALGADAPTVLRRVVLPSALPYILTGLRVALNLAFMAVVSAELIGARSGLGFLIISSQTMLETEQMLVGILSLGILGALLDRGADVVIRRGLARFTHTTA